jgi:SAM-dependent methyltransferase
MTVPQVRCAWCGGPAQPGQRGLALCRVCGSATTHPWPTKEELDRAYRGWYRPSTGRFSAGGDRLLARSRARLAARLDEVAPAGPVLDVGAGEGSLVTALRARGREALGLERFGAGEHVVAKEVVDFDQRMGQWAGVVFWHSLEHLPDPARALDQACRLLCTGGVVVIALPNLASWQARTFGSGWFHLDLPRHLVHLPESALRAGLVQRGLRVERVSHWRAGQLVFGWLHGLVRSLPGDPNLYDAIRRTEARSTSMSSSRRLGTLAAAVTLAPAAVMLAAAEAGLRHGGTVYVEARLR